MSANVSRVGALVLVVREYNMKPKSLAFFDTGSDVGSETLPALVELELEVEA